MLVQSYLQICFIVFGFRCLILAVVRQIRNVYETASKHLDSDYEARNSGEVSTQKYPLLPILREQGLYKRDCRIQDEEQKKDSCEKDFPSHSKLTPGLYLLTCACKNKCVYGFSMMVRGESPSMLFNLVMTRFEENYNPHIIYDASCLSKEYGYNRELRRFMMLRITTDRFHQCNHTTCSDSFKSSQNQDLNEAKS